MALKLLRRSSALQMRRRPFSLLTPAASRLLRFLLRNHCLIAAELFFEQHKPGAPEQGSATAALPLLVPI